MHEAANGSEADFQDLVSSTPGNLRHEANSTSIVLGVGIVEAAIRLGWERIVHEGVNTGDQIIARFVPVENKRNPEAQRICGRIRLTCRDALSALAQ